MNFIVNPVEIEKKSFEIIEKKLSGRKLDPQHINIIKRVIHTTADFDYADNLVFSDNAVKTAKICLKNGTQIVTDTQMVKSGINRKALEKFGCTVHCFIDNPEVIESAKTTGFTRAWTAVDYAVKNLENPVIFAVGNAPTALIRLHELISSAAFLPELIIAVPVGFVNVAESKELIMSLQTPNITAKGQKGGSNVAAAICNALLYEIMKIPIDSFEKKQ